MRIKKIVLAFKTGSGEFAIKKPEQIIQGEYKDDWIKEITNIAHHLPVSEFKGNWFIPSYFVQRFILSKDCKNIKARLWLCIILPVYKNLRCVYAVAKSDVVIPAIFSDGVIDEILIQEGNKMLFTASLSAEDIEDDCRQIMQVLEKEYLGSTNRREMIKSLRRLH